MHTVHPDHAGEGGELFRLLVENVRDYAVFALDAEGRVLTWSAPAEHLLGYREQEVVGQPADRFYTPEDVACGVPAQELRQALEAGRVEEDRWYVRKDGSRFWSGGVTTPLRGEYGSLRGFAKIMRDRTDVKRAEDVRKDALAYAQSIVETVREPLVVLDGGLRVRSASRSFYQTFGVTPEETEDRLLYDLGNRQWDIPRLRTHLEEVLPRNKAFNDFEVEHDFPAIGRKVMLLNARTLWCEGNHSELILLAIEDVTARRRAEEERREIETRFTSLVKNINDHAIFTLDPEGRITSWNVGAEHILGYTEAEVLGRHFSFIFTPEDRQQGRPEADLRAGREQGRAEDERWHLRKSGERFWALGIVSALRDAVGLLTGFSKTLGDRTEWKQAGQALRASEERLRRMLNIDVVGVLIFDHAGTLIEANDAFLRLCGYTREDVAARRLTWRTMTPPEYVAESERQLGLLAATGRLGPYEKEYLRKDGSRSWLLFAGAGLGDRTVVEYCIDISDRKRAEGALQEREAWLRGQREALEAALNDAPLQTSLGALVRTATDALGQDTRAAFYLANGEGTSLHHVVGMSACYAEAIDGFKIGPESPACGLAMHTGQPVLTSDVTKDPRWEPWLWLAERSDFRACWSFPVHTSAGKFVGTLAVYSRQPREAAQRDLELASLLTQTAAIIISRHTETEVRKQAEAALRESEERLRVALAAGEMGTWLYRVPTDEQVLGDSMRRLAGLPPDVAAMPLDQFLRVVHDEDRDRVRAEFECCLRDGRDIDTEFRVTWPDGSVHWLKDRGKSYPGPDGQRLFVTGTAVDITGRKRLEDDLRQARDELERRVEERTAELRESQRRALQAERLAVIGQTVTILAHDGRNALQRADACLSRLEWRLEGRAEELELAQRGQDALKDLEHLFDDIRNYASPIQLDQQVCDLGQLLREEWSQVVRQHPDRDVQLEEDLGGSGPRCEADPFRLRQVFANLFTNALEACPDPVRVVVAWRKVCLKDQPAVEITVRDNGPGFTPERRQRALEPFFTTKPKGTGLGLAITQRIVEAHGGSIVLGEGEGGATIILTLPCRPPSSAEW